MATTTFPPHASALTANPAGWPQELLPVFAQALTVEYASLTRDGTPVTVPVTPYVGPDGLTLDVSTGLTYPAKAERARRNPKVALLFSDATGSGLSDAPVALVQGLATVRDAELQTNTDRYVRSSMQKMPGAYARQPRFLLRRLSWYFARIWVQVTPLRILWWPQGRIDTEPRVWQAPAGTTAPPSDPAPPGRKPPAWNEPRSHWREVAARAGEFLYRDLTVVTEDGFPVCVPLADLVYEEDRLSLRPGGQRGSYPEGPACLTLHTHDEGFTYQENQTLIGHLSPEQDDEYRLGVERMLGSWTLPPNRFRSTIDFLRKGRRLGPRLESEAARRDQPVPRVSLPD